MNLFNFEPEYYDKYAGYGSKEKYRKWVSKSNVDMVLNRFAPFTKAKGLKNATSTIISMDGTNIDDVDAPISYHSNGSENKIYVNTQHLDERLAKFDIADREGEFKRLMRGAYVARADAESINSRSDIWRFEGKIYDLMSRKDDHGMNNTKLKNLADTMRQIFVATQMIVRKCHMKRELPELTENQSKDGILSLNYALATGETTGNRWADDMYLKAHALSAKRGDYNNFADLVVSKFETDFASTAQQDMSDEETLLLDSDLPITRKYLSKQDKEKGEHGKEACKVGNGQLEVSDDPSFVENAKPTDQEFTDTNDVLDTGDMEPHTKSAFFRDNNEGKTWKERDARMEKLSEALYESLAGRIGKHNGQTPSKKLNQRAFANKYNPNIYESKVPLGGKHLNVNLVLDTSGSMTGYPLVEGVDVINCFNKLAQRGVISGNLMLTASRASAMFKLPINPSLLPKISAHNGGEGYKHTIALRWKELKAADYNVAITDGMLTDGHIDLKEQTRAGIEIIGLHAVRNVKHVTAYTGSLKRWFNNSAVRKNAEEMVYYIIDNALLNFNNNPRRVA